MTIPHKPEIGDNLMYAVIWCTGLLCAAVILVVLSWPETECVYGHKPLSEMSDEQL